MVRKKTFKLVPLRSIRVYQFNFYEPTQQDSNLDIWCRRRPLQTTMMVFCQEVAMFCCSSEPTNVHQLDQFDFTMSLDNLTRIGNLVLVRLSNPDAIQRDLIRQRNIPTRWIGPRVKHKWNVTMDMLHQNICYAINTTTYHSCQYKPSSLSTNEQHTPRLIVPIGSQK